LSSQVGIAQLGTYEGEQQHISTSKQYMSMQVISPKFSAENIEKNNVLRERVVAIAEKKKCSLNQLALAWVMHKGKDVVPIPGTTKRANLESNIGSVAISLTKEEIAEIEAAVPANEVAGERYNERLMKVTWLNAVSPPLSSWMG
jgi:aryl-alcohol dehydrogenase-like predicted oxidoreductase